MWQILGVWFICAKILSMRIAFLKVGEYEGLLRHFKAFAGRFRERGAEVLELDIGQGDLN